jgi:hypothetical protein
MTDEHDISGLPPLDPDTGLIRRAWNAGDHIDVEVMTAAKALDQGAQLVERNWAPHQGDYPEEDAPDEMHVAEEKRPSPPALPRSRTTRR